VYHRCVLDLPEFICRKKVQTVSSDFPQAPNPYSSDSVTPLAPPDNPNLTAVDWIICVLCSGIGCILGIVRMVQGKANGAKMIGFSLLFMVIWTIIRLAIVAAINNGQN
jgi:hypothetical protein